MCNRMMIIVFCNIILVFFYIHHGDTNNCIVNNCDVNFLESMAASTVPETTTTINKEEMHLHFSTKSVFMYKAVMLFNQTTLL